ncbi:MAG: hypothetical protein IJV72_06965 [Clostridia bacterium]|nr:hypothetical protein [Clostridia bacterium]
MGKSNRVRAERASKSLSAPVKIKTKKKTGMPLWLKTLIAAVMALVVLCVCVFGILSANGVIMRYRSALKSDHFKVSGNMMSYYYYTQYQSFQSQYSSYMSYFSLDTSKSLKEQQFGDSTSGNAYETSFLGEFDGTWHDYFMSKTTEQTEQILIYCEEAYERDITLDDEDIAEIDESLETLKTTAATYGYSPNAYTANMYGAGVSVNDVKKAMKLSKLAEKCMLELQDEILEGISDGDIQTKYNENKSDFNIIDYSYYTIEVKYEDIATEILGSGYSEAELKESADKVLEDYKHHIEEAKAVAEKMKASKSVGEFNEYLYNYLADKYYDEEIEKISVADDKIPESDNDKETIKSQLIKAVVSDILADLDKTAADSVNKDGKYTLYSCEVSKEYATAIDSLKTKVFDSVLADKGTYLVEKATFVEDDVFSEWAFEDGRKSGETKMILEGDGAEGEVSDDEGFFTISVYFLTEAQRCDETLTKNIIYMVFTDKELAEDAIAKFEAGEISAEAFEEIAHDIGADAHNEYDDYTKGALGVDAFDKWLFADDTTKGDYTKTPIAADDSSYVVAYYHDDGKPAWKVTVEETIFGERFEEKYNSMTEAYTVTVKDNVLKKIGD